MACCWTCFYTFNSPTPPFFGGNSQCTITFPSHWWTERATSSCMMTLVRSGLLLSSSPFQPVAAALFGSPTIAYSCPFLPTKALLTFSALSRICVKIASQHSHIRFWMLCCPLTNFGWKKWGFFQEVFYPCFNLMARCPINSFNQFFWWCSNDRQGAGHLALQGIKHL